MLHLLGWIILGGLAGWLASVITGRREGCLMDVVVGIVGAFIGGILYNLFTGNGFSLTIQPLSMTSLVGFVVAVGGAVVLLLIVKLVTRPR
jgi:uncharacterized membrane protein YeaQ/YmgE (transglycosylase-associated protein family)